MASALTIDAGSVVPPGRIVFVNISVRRRRDLSVFDGPLAAADDGYRFD
jgi:hypothetical protein